MQEKRKYVVEDQLVYMAETRRYVGTLESVESAGIDVDETTVSPWVTSREPKPSPPAAEPGATPPTPTGDRLAVGGDEYTGLTIGQLKDMLDGADVSYPSRAKIADLVKLARAEIG